jgi:hypothetical protein
VQGGHKVVVFSEWEKMQVLAAEVATRLKRSRLAERGGGGEGEGATQGGRRDCASERRAADEPELGYGKEGS